MRARRRGLFAGAGGGGLAFPRPEAAALGGEGPRLLRLLGLLLGKALWEGMLLGAPLAPFFVARLQGRRPLLDDLAALDPQLHKSLTALKRCGLSGRVRVSTSNLNPHCTLTANSVQPFPTNWTACRAGCRP